ncbi:MAG: hypothetical protein U9Q40_07460 [Campylobacterota bacterium]|nr:hypothetical protein [Campylobacterota bacterium]
MNILCSELYETQLKEILELVLSQSDYQTAKKFKLYLDTIILNMPTKAKKYKKSIFFDDEYIKDIEYENYLIPFVFDDENKIFTVLGIVKK